MDWTRARAILLAAFAVVNLILAYSLWGPKGEMDPSEPTARSQLVQLRARLDERGLLLPSGVTVPTTPAPMRFLRVEFRQDPTKSGSSGEVSEGAADGAGLRARYDAGTRETVLVPVNRDEQTPVDLSDRVALREAAEDFLREHGLLPAEVQLSGIFLREDGAMVEFVPAFEGLPVFSGYLPRLPLGAGDRAGGAALGGAGGVQGWRREKRSAPRRRPCCGWPAICRRAASTSAPSWT